MKAWMCFLFCLWRQEASCLERVSVCFQNFQPFQNQNKEKITSENPVFSILTKYAYIFAI